MFDAVQYYCVANRWPRNLQKIQAADVTVVTFIFHFISKPGLLLKKVYNRDFVVKLASKKSF